MSQDLTIPADVLAAARVEAVAYAEGKEAAKSRYCPHDPYGRQLLFLRDLATEVEAFYGGAAGGMKSDALLQAALEYVDQPGYAALILRRTYADLSKPGALMSRAHEWLRNTPAKWDGIAHQWRFPSGAVLQFGYLDTENDKLKFQSSEFQYIAFDEVTQFSETQYTYLFSRLRRLADSRVPLRMRCASNPAEDYTGYWVAERFVPDDFTPDLMETPQVFWKVGKDGKRRPFVPSRLEDNPFLDQVAYDASLDYLDPVTKAQLRTGDWRIKKRGNIFPMWNEDYHVITWDEFEAVYGTRSIPSHWACGISQDWGTTPSHPCVTTLFATAAANSALPGKVFIPWSLTLTNAQNAQQVAREHLIPELERLQLRGSLENWLMSHEASSERKSYNELELPFRAWGQDSSGGLDRVRRYLELRERDKPNPFGLVDGQGQRLSGCPQLMLIVGRRLNPQGDRDLARIRAEFAGYSWYLPKAGDPPEKLRPQKLFNDAMDTIRCYAEVQFPELVPLTAQERALEYVNKGISEEQAKADPYAAISRDMWIRKALAKEQRGHYYDIGEALAADAGEGELELPGGVFDEMDGDAIFGEMMS